VSYILPVCAGERGTAQLSCGDGRQISADWEAQSCTSGTGSGYDQNKNRFTFAFGMEEDKALEFVRTEVARSETKPVLPPVYRPREEREKRGFAVGTGFFITGAGHLITNYHVVEGASTVSVVMPGGGEVAAKVLYSDAANDIALLRIEQASKALPLYTAGRIARGEEVMTLGYPLINLQGQEQKATFGRINALSGLLDDIRYIQVDVPIQPGNSGGPLLNRQGQVIGIVTATLSQLAALRASGALPQNVNYAVKIDYVVPLLRSAEVTWKESEADDPLKPIPDVIREAEPSVVLVIAK
jgi:S1-C subfamily serine protease